jgi:hypothetical protein
VLIAFWWPIAWLRVEPLSSYYFFPLWCGYIFAVDGLVNLRTGTSLITRSLVRFVLLFICSIPFWWIFEWMNGYLDNWHYQSSERYATAAYALLASLAFSTVVPAVLEMSELVSSFGFGNRLPRVPAWRFNTPVIAAFEILGMVMLALVLRFPHDAFPLTWLSVFFIIEPVNALLGQRSIAFFARSGDWAAIWNIMLGALLTGFFWEMWNFYSMPKWTYSVPFVGFAHVFEMPLLGYSGYLPFGLEVFAIFALVFLVLLRRPQRYAIVSDATRRSVESHEASDREHDSIKDSDRQSARPGLKSAAPGRSRRS